MLPVVFQVPTRNPPKLILGKDSFCAYLQAFQPKQVYFLHTRNKWFHSILQSQGPIYLKRDKSCRDFKAGKWISQVPAMMKNFLFQRNIIWSFGLTTKRKIYDSAELVLNRLCRETTKEGILKKWTSLAKSKSPQFC